jgi:hypothetical protein
MGVEANRDKPTYPYRHPPIRPQSCVGTKDADLDALGFRVSARAGGNTNACATASASGAAAGRCSQE